MKIIVRSRGAEYLYLFLGGEGGMLQDLARDGTSGTSSGRESSSLPQGAGGKGFTTHATGQKKR